jgi:hypothetical protein
MKFWKHMTIGLLILIVTLLLAQTWATSDSLPPRLPESFWIWLMQLSGVTDQERMRDLSMIVGVALWLPIISLGAWVGMLLMRRED